MSGDWYTNSGATFVSIDSMNPKILDFDLDFEKIDFTQQLGRELVVIGTKNDTKKMVLVDTHTQKRGQYLKIPENVTLENVRIYEKDRNFFLKTRNSLLFFYRESEKLEKSWRLATLLLFMKRMMGSGLLIGATLSKIHNKK